MSYADFRDQVRERAREQGSRDLICIVELRRNASLSPPTFDEYLFRLQDEGLVHLLSHVDPNTLSPEDRQLCLVHPQGWLIYWVRWLS